MNEARRSSRELFLERMSKEAVVSYDDPYREWDEDEREYMPYFLSLVGSHKHILDLAGGYAKAAPQLLRDENSVTLADLSMTSLRDGQKALASSGVQFIQLNMLRELPFIDGAFDGVWFSEAFEYVPPDARTKFLKALRRIVKKEGVIFLNAEGLSKEQTRLSYLRNYLYWKLVKRAPVVWGEYIYMLNLPGYKGWHYHSLVLSRRIEKDFRSAGFEILKSKVSRESVYSAYVLKAV